MTTKDRRANTDTTAAALLHGPKNAEPAPGPDVRDGTQVQGDDSADASIPEQR